MLTQIRQVSLTYLTQRYLWFAIVAFGLVIVPNILVSGGSMRGQPDAAGPLMFTIAMPLLGLAPMLVGQSKMQLGHPRARLTPHFLPAHLMVAAAILLFLFVGLPLAESQIAGMPPLGVLALAAGIGAPALWGAHFNRFTPMFISLAVFYSLLTPWGLNWWLVNSAQHAAIHAAIFAAGLVTCVAWLWRLATLREEMDDYQNLYQAILARRTGSEAVEQRRILAMQVRRNKFMGAIGDWWHSRLGGYCGGSPASRSRALRFGFAAVPIEVQGIMFALMILVLGVFFTQFSFLPNKGGMNGAFFFFMQFGVILPGMMAGEVLAQRRPRVAWELLLPMSRTQLIDGLFAASARNTFVLWLLMNAGVGMWVLMLPEPPTAATVAVYLLLSSAGTLASMGISLRTSVWPAMIKRMMALYASMIILMPVLIGWWAMRESWGDWPFIAAAVVLYAAGAVLIHLARQAWLRLELV